MTNNRREILKAAGIGASLALSNAAITRPIENSKAICKIAFGACAKQDKEQPIWDAIAQKKPDLFLFLGDNIYADTRDKEIMAQKYKMLADKPQFKKFREQVPF